MGIRSEGVLPVKFGRMSFALTLALGACGAEFSAAGVSAATPGATRPGPIVNPATLDGLGTLAFCRGHDIWTVTDGKARDLGPGFRPVLSPSGRYVVCISI